MQSQVKTQLAEEAEQASEAAAAALAGKQALVDELEGEMTEAEKVVEEEAKVLQESQQHSEAAVQTAQMAGEEVHYLLQFLEFPAILRRHHLEKESTEVPIS